MSIFGKSNKKEHASAPPAPTGGFNDIKEEVSSNRSQNNSANVPPAPPSFSSQQAAPQPQQTTNPAPPSFSSQQAAPQPQQTTNPAPPSFSSQQAAPQPQESNSGVSQGFATQQQSVSQTKSSDLNSRSNALDESLFNLEDFELPDLNELDSMNRHSNNSSEGVNNNSNMSASEDLQHQSSNSQGNVRSSHNEPQQLHYHDTHGPYGSSHSDFLPTKGLSHAKDDTYFLTTNEFKHLLELIDIVKDRIKTSSQRHMKITSIKAEEDIEYDNMKKDFQFIEDKLYEVDSTIFDR